MPRSHPNDDPTWSLEVVSPGNDFIVRCKVKDEIWLENGAVSPAFGAEPEAKARLAGYKLSGIVKADEVGWHFLFYAKSREEQWKYNAEKSQVLGDDLPRLSFKWIVLRAEYYAAGTVPAVPNGQMPSFGGAFNWVLTGQRTQELDASLSGLFIEVIHDYYDTTHPLRSEEIDQETGELRSVTRALVTKDVAGHTINASGEVATYEAINSTHGWLVTRKASGGKGSMVKGRKVIITRGTKSHFWPKVLKFIGLYPVHEDSSSIYTRVIDWIVTKVFACEDYNGPCRITRVKRYTTKEPIEGGDPAWNTDSASNVSPDIPVPVPLLERAIDFRGKNLTVQCEPCLRQAYVFFDEGFAQFFPASSPLFWPESRLVDVDVYQEDGAWVTELLYVDAPDGAGRSSGLDLTPRAAALATSVQVAWTPAVGAAGPVVTKIDVALDAEFERGFLTGFRDKTVTPVSNSPTDTWTTITGMERGQPYFVRVRTASYTVGLTTYPALTSNTLVVMGKPSPELEARVNAVAVADGGTIDFGSIALGETGRLTLELASVGMITVREIDAVITGTGDAVYGIDDPVTELAAGASSTVELRFTPAALGSIAATLTITSEAGEIELTLTGIGIGPELQLEQPAGTIIANAGTVPFGTVTTGSVSKTFKLRNMGSAPLSGLALSLTGLNAADWTVTSDLTSDVIAAAGYLNFTLRFDPIESEDAYGARAAVLTITSNDADETPTVINLTGTSQSPTAPGEVDWTFDVAINGTVYALAMQPDGKLIIGGDFTTVGGVSQPYAARLNADGTLDATWNPSLNGAVLAIAVQTGDVIYLGGAFTSCNASARNRLAAVDANGDNLAWDPGADATVRCLLLDAAGELYVGGDFANISSGARDGFARLNADGTLDAFDTELPTGAKVYGCTLDEEGKILIVGDWAALPASSTPPSSTPPSSTPPSSTPPSSTPPSSTPPSSTPPSSTPPSSTPPSSTPPSSTPPSSTPPSSTPPSSTPPSSTPPSSTP